MDLSDKTVYQPNMMPDFSLAPGQVLGGKYRIERELGQGGMGVVYLATQVSLQRLVAVKVMPPGLASQEAFVDRFRREAKTLASLRHAHIVSVTDFDIDSGHYYLVLDYIDGGTLEDYCKAQGGHLGSKEAARILNEVLAGLAHAHKASIVHRDLKPANIMMEKSGEAKINDFGLARVVGDAFHRSMLERSTSLAHNSSTSAYVGTADFMAPEVKLGKQADRRADLYAMGVITYWMLAGKRPGAMAEPISRAVKTEKLSSKWDRFMARALVDDPEKRFNSAEEMQQALKEALEATHQKGPSSKTLLFGGIAAALVLAGVSWVFLKPAGEQHARTTPSPRPGTESVAQQNANVAGVPSPEQSPSQEAKQSYRPFTVQGLPPGAELTAAGQKVVADSQGVARVNIPEGPHACIVRATGYSAWQGMLGLPEQKQELKIELQTIPPRPVRLTGLPPGASVEIGGKTQVAGNDGAVTFSLTSGKVEVRAVAKKYYDFAKALDLSETANELAVPIEKIPPPKQLSLTLKGGVAVNFTRIEAGEFMAGSPADEKGRQPSEETLRSVQIEKPFYIATTEMTQGAWKALMGSNPSASRAERNDKIPVEQVSWTAIVQGNSGLIARMNKVLADNGLAYVADLPTEHEWEYACRAGEKSAFSNGANMDTPGIDAELSAIAVFSSKGSVPTPVAKLRPNKWGLYDMHGNVAEWTHGLRGPKSPTLRGGDWRALPGACRSAARVEVSDSMRPKDTMGLRLVLRPTEE